MNRRQDWLGEKFCTHSQNWLRHYSTWFFCLKINQLKAFGFCCQIGLLVSWVLFFCSGWPLEYTCREVHLDTMNRAPFKNPSEEEFIYKEKATYSMNRIRQIYFFLSNFIVLEKNHTKSRNIRTCSKRIFRYNNTKQYSQSNDLQPNSVTQPQ